MSATPGTPEAVAFHYWCEVLPEYDDDDPASISREMCPPEVLPEETP